VLNPDDDHFTDVVGQSVEDPVGPAARGPQPAQVAPQRLADPARVGQESRGDEVDDRRGDRLWQALAEGLGSLAA
jgi:hypothetical protein